MREFRARLADGGEGRVNVGQPGPTRCRLAVSLILPAPLQAGKKRLTLPRSTWRGTEPKAFDITKIVWPNPPDIPRVAFQSILTGQKIDWAGLQTTQKPKQSWMDRLAGEQPDRQVKDVQQKVGFQLMRVYGVAADSEGNIYAADQGVGAIFIFPTCGAGKVQLIKNGQDAHLPMINGLAVDDDDRLFVTDVKLHHVLVFNAKHELEAQFGAGDLISPAGIAIDTTNRFVYVVDTQAGPGAGLRRGQVHTAAADRNGGKEAHPDESRRFFPADACGGRQRRERLRHGHAEQPR